MSICTQEMNRNNVKVSLWYIGNMESIMKSHNSKILAKDNTADKSNKLCKWRTENVYALYHTWCNLQWTFLTYADNWKFLCIFICMWCIYFPLFNIWFDVLCKVLPFVLCWLRIRDTRTCKIKDHIKIKNDDFFKETTN